MAPSIKHIGDSDLFVPDINRLLEDNNGNFDFLMDIAVET